MNFPTKRWNWLTKTPTLPKRTTTFTTNWSANLLLWLLGGLVLGLSACEDPLKIGSELLPAGSQANVYFTDTLTVRTSTVLLDSVQTSGPSAGILLGRYTDPVLGRVEALGFLQVAPPTGDTLRPKANAVYDSLVLVLAYSGYSYGDTSLYQNLAVYRLTDTLDNGKIYLNTSQVPYQATALARLAYKPQFGGNSSSQLRVKLANTLGQELFNLKEKPEATDAVAFRNLIKGFAVIPGATDEGSILGFSDARLTVYYHEDTLVQAYSAYLGGISTKTGRFSRITSKPGGVLATLTKPGSQLPSTRSNNEVYFQDGAGLTAKIEFPYLSRLRTLPQGRVAINKAELILEPNLPPTNLPLPNLLALVETDDSNLPLKTAGFLRYVLQEGSAQGAQTAGYFDERYVFNITTQLQQMLTGQRTAKGLLLRGTTAVVSDVSRGVFDARKIKLRVYYSVSNN